MIIFSDRDWDTPPGTGYLTVAVITICAILTVIMTLRAPRRGADDDSHPGHKSEFAYPRLKRPQYSLIASS